MKKHIRTIVVFAILAVLGISYFFYLSNRPQERDYVSENPELANILTLDVENNYPQTPKEVLKLYVQITKAYYKTPLTDDQIKTLGMKARLLFDDELKEKQTDEQFLMALKSDIDLYNGLNRYIVDYEICNSSLIKFRTIRGEDYAIIPMKYIIRQGNETQSAYHSFKLHKDKDGRWKLLYWEAIDAVELK